MTVRAVARFTVQAVLVLWIVTAAAVAIVRVGVACVEAAPTIAALRGAK